ncbi:MAG: endonuclease III domain-containing protein [Candidatus Aenigmatarchaeota archaeon]
MAKLNKVMNLLREEYGVPQVSGRGDPIQSLIQVILSQNTNDVNRDRAYRKLTEKFNDPEDIMEAEVEEVSEVISVAGLHNTKGKRMKECLERIKEERGELTLDFLDEMDVEEAKQWLRELPGIGPKSAAVILNFTFGKEAFPVDTHVFRVTKRLGLIPEKSTREKAHEILEEKIPGERKQEFHINLIKHGREICKARKPLCGECLLSKICDFYQKKKS